MGTLRVMESFEVSRVFSGMLERLPNLATESTVWQPSSLVGTLLRCRTGFVVDGDTLQKHAR